jgi:hypothetical protein
MPRLFAASWLLSLGNAYLRPVVKGQLSFFSIV